MISHTPTNAITQRLDQLKSHWNQFAEIPEARICRWLIEADELQMIEVMYETESHEEGDLPDLFLKFETPFKHRQSYAHALLDELGRQINDDKDALQAEGIDITWQFLPFHSPDATSFLKNLAAFADSMDDLVGHLVAYLSPGQNNSAQQWNQWLMEAVALGIPQRVRLMVVDAVDHPVFDELAKTFPEQVITIRPALDMPSALRQLAGTGNPADPGVQFRNAFVAITQAAGKGNINEVQQLARRALSIAEKQGWPLMQSTIHITVGGALLGAKQYDKAFHTYAQAGAIAQQTYREGDQAGGKLVIQTCFSQGATMIAAEKYATAAFAYEQAVPLAQELDDAFNLMEAWRMAGYCHEAAKNYQRAWECNQLALEAGEQLDEKLRANSALPYVGQAQLRLSKKVKKQKENGAIHQQMETLVGTNWTYKI